jgi:hypothetical protein
MLVNTTIFKDYTDLVIETGRTLTLSLEFTEDDGTPKDLTGISFRVEIRKGGKLVKTLTDGAGFSIAANILTFNYDVVFPANCEYSYMVIASEVYGPEQTWVKGTWFIV